LAQAAGIGLFVAASWYLRNWQSVYDYLTASGYGSTATSYGTTSSALSWGYWSKELRLILDQTYLPLGVILTLCFLVPATTLTRHMSSRHRLPTLATLGGPRLALAVIVIEGYVALTSSTNEGTGFALTFLPVLVVLAVAMLEQSDASRVAAGVAVSLLVVSAGNALMKSGLDTPLATVRTTHLPSLGDISATDGRSLIQRFADAGLRDPPTRRLATIHRRWLPFDRVFTGWIVAYANSHGERPYVLTATDHQYTNQPWIALADALWYHADVFVLWPGPLRPGTTAAQYRELFEQHPMTNLVETTSTDGLVGPSSFNRRRVERALESLRFRRVRRFAMPDRSVMWFWWKPNSADRVRAAARASRRSQLHLGSAFARLRIGWKSQLLSPRAVKLRHSVGVPRRARRVGDTANVRAKATWLSP
jgi:hypothetical protein